MSHWKSTTAKYLSYYVVILNIFLVLFFWIQAKNYTYFEGSKLYDSQIKISHEKDSKYVNSLLDILEVQKLLLINQPDITQEKWNSYFSDYLTSFKHPEVVSIEYMSWPNLDVKYSYRTKEDSKQVVKSYNIYPEIVTGLEKISESGPHAVTVTGITENNVDLADTYIFLPYADANTNKLLGYNVLAVSSRKLFTELALGNPTSAISRTEFYRLETNNHYKKVSEYIGHLVPSQLPATNESFVSLPGVTYRIRYSFLPQLMLPFSSRVLPNFILLIGTLLNFLSIYIFKIYTDAKERSKIAMHQATSELRKFKLALDNVRDHLVITDAEGIILYANPMVQEITGYAPDEVIGMKAGDPRLWGGLMPKEFYKQLWATIKHEKKPFTGEIRNKRKNGEFYTAQVKIAPILNKQQEPAFFVGVERDISLEKEQERIKTQLDMFFGISADLLCIATLQGYFVKLSFSFEKVLGWPLPELMTKSFLSLVHPHDIFRIKDILQQLSKGEVTKSFTCRMLTKQGDYVDLSWNVVTDFGGFMYCTARKV